MSYLNKYKWELIPKNLPKVKRSCPKCNKKSHYINSEKFRVNANKNNLDVWVIYQCENCKSTWNMTIYERVKPYEINKSEYKKFLYNDLELIRKYAFNLSIYNKNKVEVILENMDYRLISKNLGVNYKKELELIIEIECKYLINIRIDRLLGERLGLSRSKIKKKVQVGEIFVEDNEIYLNMKIKHGMKIHILMDEENMKDLQNIV